MSQEERAEHTTNELLLRFDATNFRLIMTGNVSNFDMAIAMLSQAKRVLENQQRAAAASQIAAASVPDILRMSRGNRQ